MKYVLVLLCLWISTPIKTNLSYPAPLIIQAPLRHGHVGEYLSEYAGIALRLEKQYGIPFEIILGQAVLESGAGTSRLCKITHNHFGVKAIGREKYVIFENDTPFDKFAVYSSVSASYERHSRILSGKRYAWMKSAYGLNWSKWAAMIQPCGYASNKNYGKVLTQIINQYGIAWYRNIGNGA